MRLDVEGKKPIENVKDAQVKKAISGLRSYGPSSFAALTDENGNYLQVAGGGITCMLEKRDAVGGKHYRAYHGVPNSNYPDGTLLVFRGGEIQMRSDEWFMSQVVLEAFLAFLHGEALPEEIMWRDISNVLAG